MPTELLSDLLTSPWAIVVMMAVVFADAFLVVVPGEIAVTALGAASIAHGTPPFWLVVMCAGFAASCGDITCYGIGRVVGTSRWRILRTPKVSAAMTWAHGRLERNMAVALFSSRFIPFARMAVNVTAGATHVSFARYVGLAGLAAFGWALYQAGVGALVSAIVPGGTTVAIVVSIGVALGIGYVIDLVLKRRDG